MLERLWSEVATQVPMVESGAVASAELALLTSAGPLRLAVDGLGHRHLLVPMADDDGAVADWRSAGVQMTALVKVVDDGPVRFLDLECRRDDLTGVFTGLVADVCAVVAYERRITGLKLSAMLESWRRLLGGGPEIWTLPRVVGLYGELVILERLLEHDPSATDTWVGPSGAPQDFLRHPHAIEVKSTASPTGRLVRIHGLDQLEPPGDGSLTLIWSRFATTSPDMGDTIASVVERCLGKASSAGLLSRLDQIGMPSLNRAEMREVGFELIERRSYEVVPEFPSVIPGRFTGGVVPGGVQNLEYTIDLDFARASDEDLTTVLARFMERP